MKKILLLLSSVALAGMLASCSGSKAAETETDYTQYVNPFVGAAATGHTVPDAPRP